MSQPEMDLNNSIKKFQENISQSNLLIDILNKYKEININKNYLTILFEIAAILIDRHSNLNNDEYIVWSQARYNECQELIISSLFQKYNTFRKKLLLQLHEMESELRNSAITENSLKSSTSSQALIKELILKKFLHALICLNTTTKETKSMVCRMIKSFIEYPDIALHSIKMLNKIIGTSSRDIQYNLEIIYHFLATISTQTYLKKESNVQKSKKPSNFNPKTTVNYPCFREELSECWIKFLTNFKIPVNLYHGILRNLDSHIMPHVKNPLALADFILLSFNNGSDHIEYNPRDGDDIHQQRDLMIPIYCLKSLYSLILFHGYEYPNFYERLLTLVNPNVLSHFDNINMPSASLPLLECSRRMNSESMQMISLRNTFFTLLSESLASKHIPYDIVHQFLGKIMSCCYNTLNNYHTLCPQLICLCLALVYGIIRNHPQFYQCLLLSPSPELEQNLIGGTISLEEKNICETLNIILQGFESLSMHYSAMVRNLAKILITHIIDHCELLQKSNLVHVLNNNNEEEGIKKEKVSTAVKRLKPPVLVKEVDLKYWMYEFNEYEMIRKVYDKAKKKQMHNHKFGPAKRIRAN